MKNNSLKLIFGALVVIAFVYGFTNAKLIQDTVLTLFSTTIQEQHAESIISELKKVIISPPPLRHTISQKDAGTLSVKGVIDGTNAERVKAGLGSLTMNTKLNYAAKLKVNDMFKNQYFEHVSPQDRGPADLAKDADYDYIIIGENLALGNFKDDAALVTAWMNSPGHRANILNKKFSEIGVAVGQGMFEGNMVWLAVQEFGAPLSDCPFPEGSLHTGIEKLKNTVSAMDDDLKAKKQEISNTKSSDPSYNHKVEEYNAEVKAYNENLAILKKMIDQYNAQVKAFNACAGA